MIEPLTRAEATRLLAERLGSEAVVANLGEATTDLQHVADRPLNFYMFGAMGQCSSLALGIALARPNVRVIALDGDGSLLMNLGSLCTIASTSPENYTLVVWDNEVYQTTGGQPTATAHGADLAAIARGAGVEKAMVVRTEEELQRAYDGIIAGGGCYQWFRVAGGAEGVGRRTTASVVASIFLIVATDLVFTVIFYVLG